MRTVAQDSVSAWSASPLASDGAPTAQLAVRFVPILDVVRGVTAGYQAQPHLDTDGDDGVRGLSPLDLDLDGSQTARVLRLAVQARATLPTNTFLSVPVGAQVAALPAVRAALAGAGSLAGIVLDLTGFVGGTPVGALDAALADYKAAGALIAIGGHGAAQPELTSIVRLQPAILRLGRDWVRGIDASDSKRSAIEVIGQLAGQLDAWILAEGIESAAELRALAGLGVPLAQGEFIGSAHRGWTAVAPAAAAAVPRETRPSDGVLSPFVQPAYTARDAAAAAAVLPETSGFDLVVVVDEDQRPSVILERTGQGWVSSQAMVVSVDTPVIDVIARAMTRPRATRFTPLAATDDAGAFLGVVPLERLMHRLSSSG